MEFILLSALTRRFGPIVLFCFLVLCFEIMYHKKRSDRKDAEADRQFWQRESESNSVRKKDITYLNYIEIPIDTLPMDDHGDEELAEYQTIVKSLCGSKILNLTGMSNTDLKLEYGPANLPFITEYEENYVRLISALTNIGARLIDLGYQADAITVLNYAISIGCEIGRCYYLLATEYRKNNTPELIDELITKAEELSSINAPAIVTKLKEIRSYCN